MVLVMLLGVVPMRSPQNWNLRLDFRINVELQCQTNACKKCCISDLDS